MIRIVRFIVWLLLITVYHVGIILIFPIKNTLVGKNIIHKLNDVDVLAYLVTTEGIKEAAKEYWSWYYE